MRRRVLIRRALYYLRMLKRIPPVFAVLLVPLAARLVVVLDGWLGFLPAGLSGGVLQPSVTYLWLGAVAVIAVFFFRPRFSLRTMLLAQCVVFFLVASVVTFGPWTKAFTVPGMPIGFSADGEYVVADNPYSNPGPPFVWDARTGERSSGAAVPELHDPAVREAPNGMRVAGDEVRSSRTGAGYRFGGGDRLPLALSPSGREVLVWAVEADAVLMLSSTELWRLTRRPEWWGFLTLPAFWGLAVFLGAFCWSVERDARSLKTGFRPGWYGFIPPRD